MRLDLLGSEVAHHTRLFWRVPLAAFFTVAFPLMFLVLFNLLNADAAVESLGGVGFSQFFTPSIAVFAMATAGYTNLAIMTAIDRDEGILKRVRGTPLPPATYLAGKVIAAVLTGLASVLLMVVVGVAFFHVSVLWERIPTALLVLLVGAGTFSALGLAVASLAPNGQAAPAVANATILPLAFVSGIFFPLDQAPRWVETVASLFPLRPFVVAFGEQWYPTVEASFPAAEIGIMLAWGVLGAVLALRSFSWEPRPGGRRRTTASGSIRA